MCYLHRSRNTDIIDHCIRFAHHCRWSNDDTERLRWYGLSNTSKGFSHPGSTSSIRNFRILSASDSFRTASGIKMPFLSFEYCFPQVFSMDHLHSLPSEPLVNNDCFSDTSSVDVGRSLSCWCWSTRKASSMLTMSIQMMMVGNEQTHDAIEAVMKLLPCQFLLRLHQQGQHTMASSLRKTFFLLILLLVASFP